jgi:bacterioferritin
LWIAAPSGGGTPPSDGGRRFGSSLESAFVVKIALSALGHDDHRVRHALCTLSLALEDLAIEFGRPKSGGATAGVRCQGWLEVAMRGDQKVIEYLNSALKHELAAVNQYWLHYRILDNWGYKDFAKIWREESIEEMQHADKIVARILFLDGAPNMQSLDQLRIGRSVKEVIDCDLAAEMNARTLYLEAAKYADSINDRVTKNLFEALLADEEKHIDFLEAQLTLIGQLGEALYSQKHVGKLEE